MVGSPAVFRSGVLVGLALCCAIFDVASASPPSKRKFEVFATQPAWCAPELEALPQPNVCFVDGTRPEGRRTLVIYLHGLIAKNTTWQWTQERSIARQAKAFGFAAIVPQAPAIGRGGSGGFGWPGSPEASVESDLIDGWNTARRFLEERSGQPFEEVFVIGFSSGAYYGTSLAMRGRLDVDGYALLAGGTAPKRPSTDASHRAPIFIGVSARDRASAPAARALGYALTTWNWPHRVDEQPVGHMAGDVHVGHAISYLRGLKTPKSKS